MFKHIFIQKVLSQKVSVLFKDIYKFYIFTCFIVINSPACFIVINSPASLCLIVFRITSVPLLKDILQKLNTTLTLETMGVH